MASIQRLRRGAWRVRVYDGRDDRGRKRYRSRTVKGTRRDAQRVASDLEREVELGVSAGAGRSSLSGYLHQRWLPHVRLHKRPGTHARYAGIVARHIVPEAGHLAMRRVSPADVQRLCDAAIEQGFAPATVHLIHAVIHKALAQAVTWQLVSRNAADAVELPRIPQRKVTVLDQPALQRLFAANGSQPVYPLLVLAVLGGLRRGELLGLQWADVDFDRGFVVVRRSLTPVQGHGLVFGPTKTHQARIVDLGPFGLTALREQRTRQDSQRQRLGAGYADHDLVLSDAMGKPLQVSTVYRWVRAALARAGLPRTTRLHDLRHTHASLLLARGHALPVVSERLGHRDKTTTANLYAHALPTSQRAAARDLDAYVSGHRDDAGMTWTPSAGGPQQVWEESMERKTGFEPVTLSLARRCSTAEPLPRSRREAALRILAISVAVG